MPGIFVTVNSTSGREGTGGGHHDDKVLPFTPQPFSLGYVADTYGVIKILLETSKNRLFIKKKKKGEYNNLISRQRI